MRLLRFPPISFQEMPLGNGRDGVLSIQCEITPGDGKPGVDAFQASCPQPYSQPHPLGTPTQILCIVIKIELQE